MKLRIRGQRCEDRKTKRRSKIEEIEREKENKDEEWKGEREEEGQYTWNMN